MSAQTTTVESSGLRGARDSQWREMGTEGWTLGVDLCYIYISIPLGVKAPLPLIVLSPAESKGIGSGLVIERKGWVQECRLVSVFSLLRCQRRAFPQWNPATPAISAPPRPQRC